MLPLSHALAGAVVVAGISAALLARRYVRGQDYRAPAAFLVAAGAILTLGAGIRTIVDLRRLAAPVPSALADPAANGLFLVGVLLILLGAMLFVIAMGILLMRLVDDVQQEAVTATLQENG